MKYCIRRLTPTLVLAFFVAGTCLAQPGKKQDGNYYQVVINHEEQYSLWPAAASVPSGWTVLKAASLKASVDYLRSKK